jgi:hypothetical protein
LDTAEIAANNSISTAHGKTPFYVDKGYHPSFQLIPEQPETTITDEAGTAFADKLQDTAARCKKALVHAQEEMSRYYNQRRQGREFAVRDWIWLRTRHLSTKRPSRKLEHKKIGPFKIIERKGPLAYKLQLPNSMNRVHNVFNIVELEPFKPSTVEGQPDYINPRFELNPQV